MFPREAGWRDTGAVWDQMGPIGPAQAPTLITLLKFIPANFTSCKTGSALELMWGKNFLEGGNTSKQRRRKKWRLKSNILTQAPEHERKCTEPCWASEASA